MALPVQTPGCRNRALLHTELKQASASFVVMSDGDCFKLGIHTQSLKIHICAWQELGQLFNSGRLSEDYNSKKY